MLKKLLSRFSKPKDPKVAAEEEQARRASRDAERRAQAEAARHQNYGGL